MSGSQIAAAGLSGQITLLQQDYRDLTGQFYRLVSIKMVEAGGHRHLPAFFRVCAERQKTAQVKSNFLPQRGFSASCSIPPWRRPGCFCRCRTCCPALSAPPG